MGLHQSKNCTAKETINEMKRQPIEWEKIFANHVFDKGFASKKITFFQLNNKKQITH